MPVTVRYSATLDQPYEESEHLPVSHANNSNGSGEGGGGGVESPLQYVDSSPVNNRSPASSLLSRASSTDSLDGSVDSGGHSRQVSSDSTEYIPTRTVKSNAKPAFNPMQFVKTRSCPLYKTAEFQVKQYENVRKVKELVKEEEEAWQSNLDNWKSKRRQISHHPIQRSEETNQMEDADLDKQRKKSKTFSEIVEERSKRRASATKLPVCHDEDADDEWQCDESPVSDKSIGLLKDSNSSKLDASFESCGSDQVFHDDDLQNVSTNLKECPNSSASQKSNGTDHCDTLNGVNGRTNNSEMKVTNGCNGRTTTSLSPSEEYTFEKAIRSYAEYAESRTKLKSSSQSSDSGSKSDSDRMDLAGCCALPAKKADSEVVSQNPESLNNLMETESTREGRENGEELSIVVCLKRGSENKDFGFITKMIRGIGNGVFVESVHQRSPAEIAGLRVDDEVLAINDECTLNRSHSAIVFAIKQAVYTGRLELQVFRHKDTGKIGFVLQPLSASSPVSQKDEINLMSRVSPVRRREMSPKVDVMMRRSLFEGSLRQSSEKVANRRSLDLNNSRFKDKLASFENLDRIECNLDRKLTPQRDLAFKEKLASFKSMDSLESQDQRLNRPSLPASDVDFRKKLTSFENLNNHYSVNITKENLKLQRQERTNMFQQRQTFERTRSCDFLNSVGHSNETLIKDVPSEELYSQEAVLKDDEMLLFTLIPETSETSLPHSSAHQLSESGFESLNSNSSCTVKDDDDDVSNQVRSSSVIKTEVPVGRIIEVPDVTPDVEDFVRLVQIDSGDCICQATNAILCPDSLKDETKQSDTHLNGCDNGFKLAEDLEETEITGAIENSPPAVKLLANSQSDIIADLSYLQVDEPAVCEDWSRQDNCVDLKSDDLFDGPQQKSSVDEGSHAKASFGEQPQIDAIDLEVGGEIVVVDDEYDSPQVMPEPPKEKPPPPPCEIDNIVDVDKNSKSAKIQRVSSTKRIRKEIWRRRSDFLGIDAGNVENYIENEIKNVSPPPKVEEFLLEEKQLTDQVLQDQMRRREQEPILDLCCDTQCSSADVATILLVDEDEIARKEREIIEDLEREEQLGLVGPTSLVADQSLDSIPVKEINCIDVDKAECEIALKLEEELKFREREEHLRRQEELLRIEKERLRQEQENLLKEKVAYQQQIQKRQWNNCLLAPASEGFSTVPQSDAAFQPKPSNLDFISLDPNESRNRIPPPPPNKPKSLSPHATEVTINGTSQKSTQPIPPLAAPDHPIQLQIEDGTKADVSCLTSLEYAMTPPPAQIKSKQMIHALSASPKAKLMDGDQWLARRKSDNLRRENSYNQQHWLIQEAEMRRLLQQQEREGREGERVSPPRVSSHSPKSTSSNLEWKQYNSVLPNASSQPQQRKPLQNGSSCSVQKIAVGQHQNVRGFSSHQPLDSHSSSTSSHYPVQHHPNHQPIYGQTENRSHPPPPFHKNGSVGVTHQAHNSVPPALGEKDPQMLSVSGKKKCSHCTQELGRGAAMIIESLQLFYHIQCFKCCVCHMQLGNGTSGADVRVRNQKLHCHNCYSNDEGLKFSKV